MCTLLAQGMLRADHDDPVHKIMEQDTMNIFKLSAAAFGVLVTVLATTPDANATVIDPRERTSFNEGRTLLDASGGAASTTFSTGVDATRVIDGAVQLDIRDIRYWWKTRPGQTDYDARNEAANAWTFTLSHAGTTANLGGLAGATNDHWVRTSAFDGVTAGGDWVLTATSNYFHNAKKQIEFNLTGFFYTIAGNPGGGQVPAPATLFLILAGLAGMAGARRKV